MPHQNTPVADLLPKSVKDTLPAGAQAITEIQALELSDWIAAGKEGPIPISGVDMADIDALVEAWDQGEGMELGDDITAGACCCCTFACCCTAAAQVDSIRSRKIL